MPDSDLPTWLIGEDRYTRMTTRYYVIHTGEPSVIVVIDDDRWRLVTASPVLGQIAGKRGLRLCNKSSVWGFRPAAFLRSPHRPQL